MPDRAFDAVVFDMDGVLIDSEPFWQEAEIELFATVGLELTRAMCRRTMGLRIDEVVSYWHERHPWKHPTRDEMAARVIARVAQLVGEQGRLLPGVHEALELVSRCGLAAGLASSSFRRLVDAVLDRFELQGRFSAIVSGEEAAAGKPDPSIYLTAARRLGVPAPRCLAIEDSPNGVRAAVRAGMICYAVRNPHAEPETLTEANQVLGSLLELDEAALDFRRFRR